MLPTDSTVGNGRYRLLSKVVENGTTRLYKAEIILTGQTVGILEYPQSLDPVPAKTTLHPGLVLFNNEFVESGRRFLVSEPLFNGLSASNAQPPRSREMAAGLYDDLKTIIAATEAASDSHGPHNVHPIDPQSLVLAANGKVKLLFSGKPADENTFTADSPYLPLESIWDQIDIIAHKTIYNSYDPEGLAVLEAAPDERTSSYTIAAVFYKLLTGHEPPSALERSLELISSGTDSLGSPIHVNPDLTADQSDQLLRMLSLRREQRVDAEPIADIVIAELDEPAPIMDPIHVSFSAASDDDDLLEIPDTPFVPRQPVIVRAKTVDSATIAAVPENRSNIDVVNETVSTEAPLEADTRPEAEREFTFASAPKRSSRSTTLFAAAAVILAVAAIGIYALISGTTADAVTNEAMRSVKPVVESPSAAVDAQPILVEPAPSVEPEPIKASTTETESDAPAATQSSTPGDAVKRKVQIAESKQRNEPSPAKETTAPRAEPKPKKKVTVDDLINDN